MSESKDEEQKELPMFYGRKELECRGGVSGGGCRKRAKAHLAGLGTNVPLTAYGPRLDHKVAEGSDAVKASRKMDVDKDLKVEGGAEKTIATFYETRGTQSAPRRRSSRRSRLSPRNSARNSENEQRSS